MTEKQLIVACPHCQKKVAWNPENPYRPFCCERCKLIDLGEWADEKKAIPGEPVDPYFETGEDSFFQ